MEDFRTVCDLPDFRIDRREECVGILYDRMDMGHDETVHVGDRLCVNLASAHDEATGIPGLVGNDGSRRGCDCRISRQALLRNGVCFCQRRHNYNTFWSFKATGNDDIESLGERTSYGLECLAAHDDRTAHGRALEELQILGNMPQKSIVLSYGIIVRYRYYDAFFHFQWF